jgi:methionyl-tRNA formyltransferase
MRESTNFSNPPFVMTNSTSNHIPRLAFMGTPAFALSALQALVAAGYPPVAVYSQPPRPAGRGQKLQPSPVHAWALGQGLAVHTPLSLKSFEEQEVWRNLALDGAVVAAYGLLLPPPILQAPIHGCLNLHASLLPRWRGAAPIQRALMAGDGITGITLMQMDQGLDTGAMLAKAEVPIGAEDTGGTLHDKLAAAAAGLLLNHLPQWLSGDLQGKAQPDQGATYAAKLTKADQQLDFSCPADELSLQIRAMAPRPAVAIEDRGNRLKILAAQAYVLYDGEAGSTRPGDWLADGLSLRCGQLADGTATALRLLTVQPAGKNPMPAADWRRGSPLSHTP